MTRIESVIVDATEFTLLAKSKTNPNYVKHTINFKWNPLTVRAIKLNTNDSVKNNSSSGDLGGLFHGHNGEWILGFYQHIPHTSPTIDGLFVIQCGLRLAREHNSTCFGIELDSTVAI